jgi:Dolichyl-phosphate-mannose-protein mannosyltransferase
VCGVLTSVRHDRRVPRLKAVLSRWRDHGDGPAGRYRGPFGTDVLVAALAMVGVGIRIVMLSRATGGIDGDEAIAGLMARHALHGHLSTFFWGQSYGGTQEPLLTAVFVATLGPTQLALKAAPLMLGVVSCLLVWRIGRKIAGERVAPLAAALWWVWPATFVWWSTKERGFYWVSLDLGLAVLLTAIRLREDPRRTLDWAWLGLAGGLGWWASPQIVLFLAPVTLYLVWYLRHLVRHAAVWGALISLACAVLGAAPWIVYNLGHGMVSLHLPTQPARQGYGGHLHTFAFRGLPMALGVKIPYIESWAPHGQVTYVAVLAVLVFGASRTLETPDQRLVLATALMFPFLEAVSPFAFYVGEGRYLLFLGPLLALLLAQAAGPSIAFRWGLAAAAVALTVAMLGPLTKWTVVGGAGTPVPVSIAPLLRTLDALHARYVVADFDLAYRIDYESGERVTAVPIGIGSDRYPPDRAAVRRAKNIAVVFVAAPGAHAYEAKLAGLHVGFAVVRSGHFFVYLPAVQVWPDLPIGPPPKSS